jgi:hypothetical protein
VDARLARLPREIASGVDLDRMSQTMGASFRQQLASVGLDNTLTLLRSLTQDVSALSGEISAAFKLVTQEYKGVSATIATVLGTLTESSRQLRQHNALPMVQERWNAWLWQVLLAILLFLVGGLCGVALEKQRQAMFTATGVADGARPNDRQGSTSICAFQEGGGAS